MARIMHGCKEVTYFHLMFEAHQIVFANGAPTESFYPGPQALGALSNDALSEVLEIFPDFESALPHDIFGPHARVFTIRRELPGHLRALHQAVR